MIKKTSARLVYLILSGGNTLADTIMFTVNMVYFVEIIGLSPLQLVLVGTVLEGAILLFEIPTGVLADTIGRKVSIVTGWFIMAGGFLLVGIVPELWAVFIGQVLWGLGYTFTSGATEAWLADEIGEDLVGKINIESGQINRILGLIGSAISVAIASVALNLPIVIGGLMYLFLAVFLLFTMPETQFTPRYKSSKSLETPFQSFIQTFQEGVKAVGKSPILLALLLVELFIGAASEGYDRLSSAHLLKNFQIPPIGALQPVVWFGILNITGSLASFSMTAMLRKKLEVISQSYQLAARYLVLLHSLGIAMVVMLALTGNFLCSNSRHSSQRSNGSVNLPVIQCLAGAKYPPNHTSDRYLIVGQANAFGQVVGGPGIGAVGNRSLRLAILLTALLSIPALLLYTSAQKKQTVFSPESTR